MFGYVVADRGSLSEEEFARYRAAYCGLCAAIRRRHGTLRGLTLTYDLTLLPLLFGALYLPKETACSARCPAHPLKKQPRWQNEYTDYAADMNVILFYYKLLDDWQDDHDLARLAAAQCLRGSCRQVQAAYPRQCRAIRDALAQLSAVERRADPDLDAGAHWFGVLLGELFWLREDAFAEQLRQLGYFLGKFIYLLDASLDLRSDLKKRRYNPLAFAEMTDHTPLLAAMIGEAAARLEQLPLQRDQRLLKNIFYSGVWTRRRLAEARQQKKNRQEG